MGGSGLAWGRRHKARELPGAWLAFLAATVQVFLPFLVAYEITLAGNPAYAAAFAICHAPSTQSAAPGNNADDHNSSGGCPICAAMAVGQAFTTPAPIAAPLPRANGYIDFDVAFVVQRGDRACISYNSRAPPALI